VAAEEVADVVREEVGAVVLAAELLEEVVGEEVEAAVRYDSIRQHTSAYVSIRQHTSAYVSIRQQEVEAAVRYGLGWSGAG
jgi:hypothetical protein